MTTAILSQATTEVPWKYFPAWFFGLIAFASVVLLGLMIVYYGKKVLGRKPPIDDDLKKLRGEIYHAKNAVKKELKELIAIEAERITKLEERYEEMQLDRERKWKELRDDFQTLATTLAFIRGKFEKEIK